MPNPFKKLLVPTPDPRAQAFIGKRLQMAELLSRWSAQIGNFATAIIELLIESKFDESDLIAAHADPIADKALLQRFKATGFDVEGEPPLFPNLDALYEAVDDSAEGFTTAV